MTPRLTLSIFLSLFAATVLVTTPLAVAAKKTVWCAVEKKSGDYTADCFKTKSECNAFIQKKGASKFECGANNG